MHCHVEFKSNNFTIVFCSRLFFAFVCDINFVLEGFSWVQGVCYTQYAFQDKVTKWLFSVYIYRGETTGLIQLNMSFGPIPRVLLNRNSTSLMHLLIEVILFWPIFLRWTVQWSGCTKIKLKVATKIVWLHYNHMTYCTDPVHFFPQIELLATRWACPVAMEINFWRNLFQPKFCWNDRENGYANHTCNYLAC